MGNNTLNPREREVLQLVYEGLRNEEIAKKLNVSIHTVKVHLANIFYKLDIQNGRLELMARRIKELENGIRRIYF